MTVPEEKSEAGRASRPWVKVGLIGLALHLVLFVYPVLRISAWLELSLLTWSLLLLVVTSSQLIARGVLRNPKTGISRVIRQALDFVLGVSPILVVATLLAELLIWFDLLSESIAAWVVIGCLIVGGARGLYAALIPMVRRIELEYPQLREPLSLVQITDVHIGSRNQAFLERIVDRVAELKPDILCITGDLIDQKGVQQSVLSCFSELTMPIYFVIGNHERYEDLQDILTRLGKVGVQTLRNTSCWFRPDVQIVGIDDKDDSQQVEKQLRQIQISSTVFTLLLYHRPEGLVAAAHAGIQLMLSGHTHNGQIFPFNVLVAKVFEYVEGLFSYHGTHLYVSQGTGTWGPVLRLGTRAEITWFELKPAS